MDKPISTSVAFQVLLFMGWRCLLSVVLYPT